MDKKVLHDYINALRISNIRKMLGKNGQTGALVWAIYMMTVSFVTMSNEKTNLGGYLMAVLFLMFAIVSGAAAAIGLPKQMFLVPMTMQERYSYLKGMLRLKLLVPNLFNAVAIVIWTKLQHAPAWAGAAFFIAGCAFVIGDAFASWRGNSWLREGNEKLYERVYDKAQRTLLTQCILEMVIGGSAYMVGVIALEPGDYEKLWIKIVTGIVAGIEIILAALILRHRDTVVELGCDYEKVALLNSDTGKAKVNNR